MSSARKTAISLTLQLSGISKVRRLTTSTTTRKFGKWHNISHMNYKLTRVLASAMLRMGRTLICLVETLLITRLS